MEKEEGALSLSSTQSDASAASVASAAAAASALIVADETVASTATAATVAPATRSVAIHPRGIIECGWWDQCRTTFAEVFAAWTEKPEEVSRIHIVSLRGDQVAAFMEMVSFGRLREIMILETTMDVQTYVEVVRRSPLLEKLTIFQLYEAGKPFVPWDFTFLNDGSDAPVSTSIESIQFDKAIVGVGHLLQRLPSLSHFTMGVSFDLGSVLPLPPAVCRRLESLSCMSYPNKLEHATALFESVDPEKFNTLRIRIENPFTGWHGVVPAQLRGVRTLELMSIDADGFARIIASFPALESLSLSHSTVHFADLHADVRSDRLTTLAMNHAGLVQADIEQIALRFPNLRNLDIMGNHATLKPADLAPIASLANLEQLCVAYLENRLFAPAVNELLHRMPQLHIVMHSPYQAAAATVSAWRAVHSRKTFIPVPKRILTSFWGDGVAAAPAAVRVAVCRGGTRVPLGDATMAMSSLLRGVVEMDGDVAEVPLPDVDASVLERIQAICGFVAQYKLLRLSKPMVKIPLVQLLPAFVWDQLGAHDMDTLLQLLAAANYMQVDVVYDLASMRIFEVIKDMKPDEIRAMLCIPQ